MIILTLFYQIMGILIGLDIIFYDDKLLSFSTILFSLSLNISMFLLQEHNSKQYEKFLYIIKVYLCCCCKKSSLFDPLAETSFNANTNESNKNDETVYETHDISENHARVTRDVSALSIESESRANNSR